MDELRVRLLGGLDVEGLAPHEIGSRKARTLLKALATAGGAAVPVDRLVEIVWGDDLPSRPADQLGVLVSRLRNVLGSDRIVRGDAGYSLRADWIDVAELAARVDEAASRLATRRAPSARAAAAAATALVRGKLLPDDDGEWFDIARHNAARLVGRARVLAAEAAMATGDRAGAAAEAEAALDHDPYDEAALRLAMTALAEGGRPASALALYARVRERLADDLGVSPTAETEALHGTILLGDLEPAPAAAAAGSDRLVGRAAELETLGRLLDGVTSDGAALVDVEGEAGIGKTTLVSAWADVASSSALVIVGRCEEAGRALPLQPVLDGLEAHLRLLDSDRAAEALGNDAGLVGGVLGRGPAPVPAMTAPGTDDTGANQTALFGAILAVVERAAHGRAVVVIVEDIHHAGPSTVEWLRFAVRRGRRLLAVTTRRTGEGPSLPGARVVALGPLDLDAVTALVGAERAVELHDRSGGNPLFLVELAEAGDALPASVRDAVTARADELGPPAATLRMAAVLGGVLDVDLLAEVLDVPVTTLLEHVDAGLRVRLLADDAGAIVFSHELVREGLAASVTPARRAFAHRAAAKALAARPRHDPLTVAWHAQHGGDVELAAAALVEAAAMAAGRYDLAAAEGHLDRAVALADNASARLARARIRMVRWELEAAAADAERALTMGGGVGALELAGWIAYYRRDHAASARFVDAAIERAIEPQVRSSCLVLAGRLRHATGDLASADALLTEAEGIAPPGMRGLPRVWLASLRVHQGRMAEAHDLAERAMLDRDTIEHAYAGHHGLFADAYALGLLGRPVEGFAAVTRLDAVLGEQGDAALRFTGIAANLRGWLLRGVGRIDEAFERHQVAVELPDLLPFAEPRYAGLLDVVELHLAAGHPSEADAVLAALEAVEERTGSMYWHQRQRYRLLRARLALTSGDADAAAEIAAGVTADMAARGAPRYESWGRAVEIQARATGGEAVDPDTVESVLGQVAANAGLESWWIAAEVAAATGVERHWQEAERLAGVLVAAAGADADALADHVGVRLARLGRRSR